jgi:hypothetical protein
MLLFLLLVPLLTARVHNVTLMLFPALTSVWCTRCVAYVRDGTALFRPIIACFPVARNTSMRAIIVLIALWHGNRLWLYVLTVDISALCDFLDIPR